MITQAYTARNSAALKGEAHGRTSYVTYCPQEPITDLANPERHPHTTVSAFTKKATCRNGHTWMVL